MAPKRPREDDAIGEGRSVKPRSTGFVVGPQNLPDGTWRRKCRHMDGSFSFPVCILYHGHLSNLLSAIKIKHDLIHKAKVKKSYAKIKAREPPVDTVIANHISESHRQLEDISQELHPERQAMLDAPQALTPPQQHQLQPHQQNRDRRKSQKPAYFVKEMAFAEQKQADADARKVEYERRENERTQKKEERERFRKAMAKARTGGKNGQRKLGRESKVLLEKVRRVVGES
jgi:hypothetical protein